MTLKSAEHTAVGLKRLNEYVCRLTYCSLRCRLYDDCKGLRRTHTLSSESHQIRRSCSDSIRSVAFEEWRHWFN